MEFSACPFCGETKVAPRYHIKEHKIVRCAACTMMWLHPMPAPGSLTTVYDENYFTNKNFFDSDTTNIYGYYDYMAERFNKQVGYLPMVRTIKDHLEGFRPSASRLLDVGCGLGFLMDVAQDEGFSVQGIEFNKSAVEHIRKKFTFPVISADIQEYQDAPYDVITMMDVIEHLYNPFEAIKNVNRLLRQGGLLVLSTMDCDSIVCRMLGARLEDFRRVKEHLFFFTREATRNLLEREGFSVVNVKSYGHTFRLDFLAARIKLISPLAGSLLSFFVNALHLQSVQVSIDPLTKFLLIARKVRDVEAGRQPTAIDHLKAA